MPLQEDRPQRERFGAPCTRGTIPQPCASARSRRWCMRRRCRTDYAARVVRSANGSIRFVASDAGYRRPNAGERAMRQRKRQRQRQRTNRMVRKRGALRQQRRDFVGANRDECACRNGVATSNGTAGKDCEDGQKTAKREAAVAAVGDGAVSARNARMLTSIPPHRRNSDSHDYTRLDSVEISSASLRQT